MSIRKSALLVLILVALASTYCGASVPTVINYQGKLMQPSGVPVADGSYSIQFAIYDTPTGGTALWSETNPNVQVKSGLFSVLLGSVVNLPGNIFDGPGRFFGVKVGSDPEMTPRQQIASVAYAQTAGNGVPTGGVIMWSGRIDQVPAGWALCNGQNGTPDLRNRFIVGAGDQYAVGEIGGFKEVTLTVQQMPTHRHGVNDPGHSHNVYGRVLSQGSGTEFRELGGPTTPAPLNSGLTYPATTGITLQNTGGNQPHENRPPYYALCFIMKVGS